MKKIEIYTEDKGNLGKIVSDFFQGFTLIKSLGFWHGQAENSALIILIINNNEMDKVKSLVSHIKDVNRQESVLYTEQTVNAHF